MRVAVAGSSGLIGTALVPELRGAGHEVLRLVRRAASGPDERGWDPPAGTIAAGALDGVDAVINLCGAGVADRRWTHARKQVLLDSRTEPTEVLANAVADTGIPLLVNASAVGWYGDTGNREVDETEPSGGGFLAALCRQWEAAADRARDAGARVVHLRIGHVLAADGGLLARLRPLFRLGLGGKLGNGHQYMPWIHLADVTSAIRFILTDDTVSGPVNLCAPTPVTNADLTRALAGAVHRPAPWVVPRFALRIAFGEVADEILFGQRVLPRVLLDAGFTFRHTAIDGALAALLRVGESGVAAG